MSSELPEEKATPLWQLILVQFQDQLVLILFGCRIGFFLYWRFFEENEGSAWGAFIEPLVILLILIANATVGVLQESSAEKSIGALKSLCSGSKHKWCVMMVHCTKY